MATRLTPKRSDQFTKNYCEENIYWLARRYSEEGYNIRCIFVVFISNQSQQVPIWSQRSSIRPDQMAIWDYHVVLLALPGFKGSKTTEALQQEQGPPFIFDLDSLLPLPTTLRNYIQQALVLNSTNLPEMYRRLFRIVPAAMYLANFSSDRSHMLKTNLSNSVPGGGLCAGGSAINTHTNNVNNEYMSPPPRYPCILSTNGDTNTFPRYLEMPSFNQAVNDWKKSPLEKFINSGNSGVELDSLLDYGVVLTEDAFLKFAREATLV